MAMYNFDVVVVEINGIYGFLIYIYIYMIHDISFDLYFDTFDLDTWILVILWSNTF